MTYYQDQQVHNALNENYAFIQVHLKDHVLNITLDRPEKKNALHPQMINELAFVFQFAKTNKDVWVVSIDANGDTFCAGADLKAFMGELGEFTSSIPKPNGEILIAHLFKNVYKPIITIVEGDVYAGGFFFLTGATYVIADWRVQFGLPEVKRGLFPFQVMSTMLEVISKRKVIDWCLRGYNVQAPEAHEMGLVTHLAKDKSVQDLLAKIVNDLKSNSPSAIRLGLQAFDVIQSKESQHQYLLDMLKTTIQTKDAKEGIQAFKEKREPVWMGE
ncbi:MAG: enoyl-CoA hydratase-related protein [Flavobacteriales bacterium]|nr:enoyl-CoA hydratase-related protein [Flavobacteriales bacterium]